MADVKEISMKRKRLSLPAAHSLMGIFSRSKSQVHFHRNGSGQCRPERNLGGDHQNLLQPSVKKLKNSLPAEDSSMSLNLSSVSIKDLRLKRVFSPSSTDGVIPNCLADDTENLGKSEVAGICENGDFKILDRLNEDFVQSTPPDADIFGAKLVVEKNGSELSDQFLEKKPSENLQTNDACTTEKGFHEQRDGMNYSMKSVLKPSSRVKLFKTPGSFSYRRLLPYLMDIEKGHSRFQIKGQCQKTEKGFEDKQLLTSSGQITFSDKSKTTGCSLEGHNTDSGSQIMGHCQKNDKGSEEKQLLASDGEETLSDKSKTTGCSLEGHNVDSGKLSVGVSIESISQDNEYSSMPLFNEGIRKLELQASCEDQNLNCLRQDSYSTMEDSHFKEENLACVVSGDKTLTDDGEVAKIDIEYPCSARSLEDMDQTLSTVNDKCEPCDYDVTENFNDDNKKSEVQGMPKATICHSFGCQHLNSVDPALSEMGGSRKCNLQQRVDNADEVMERVEDLNGDCMSMTPPESDMSSKYETDDCRGNRMDYVSQGIDHVIQKSTNETFLRNDGLGSDKSPDSSPKNKLVLNPRLHLKLSKIPGSFSYRRLLPFLINITSDYSCTSGNNQALKVEKSFEKKPLSTFFTSGKDTRVETFHGKSCPIERHTGDDILLPVAAATAMSSSNHKLTQSPPKQAADSPLTMDSQWEQGPLVKPAALDTSQNLETSPKTVVESPAISSIALINSALLPREGGAKLVANQLPLETEDDCIKSTEKCANHGKQIEADRFVEASIPPGIPSAGVKKGILKRNPHGCRGICTCLNCSSFRLHAERSFEFSRNQMQDAEEVALDLIKELSYLRTLLENSAFFAKDHTNISINQVKEACKKASDAEEVAKSCLSEMNYNLNIHCRIPCGQRPSVRFANYVEEQVILPIADLSKT